MSASALLCYLYIYLSFPLSLLPWCLIAFCNSKKVVHENVSLSLTLHDSLQPLVYA